MTEDSRRTSDTIVELDRIYDALERAIESTELEEITRLVDEREPLIEQLREARAQSPVPTSEAARIIARENRLQAAIAAVLQNLRDGLQAANAQRRAAQTYTKAQRRA